MKLRLEKDTVKFRLSPDEIKTLKVEKSISEKVSHTHALILLRTVVCRNVNVLKRNELTGRHHLPYQSQMFQSCTKK